MYLKDSLYKLVNNCNPSFVEKTKEEDFNGKKKIVSDDEESSDEVLINLKEQINVL